MMTQFTFNGRNEGDDTNDGSNTEKGPKEAQ